MASPSNNTFYRFGGYVNYNIYEKGKWSIRPAVSLGMSFFELGSSKAVAAGKQNGVLSLGSYRPQGVGSIANHLLPEIVQRTAEQAVLVPKSIIASEVNETMLGQWVQLENLQLLKSETAKTFAGEAFDRFNGERPLRSCSDGRSLWLSSSVYADFKSVQLPTGSDKLNAILTRDFYDEKYVLKINRPEDMKFTGPRCDGFFEAYFETAYLGKFAAKG